MRKLIPLILILSLFAIPSYAEFGMGPGPGVKGYPSSVLKDSNTATSGDTRELLRYDDTLWVGVTWTAGSTYTLTSVDVYLDAEGTLTGNMTASIYTNSSGSPGTLVGTASNSVAKSTVPGSETAINFPGMSASISNATAYWIVITGDRNETNYLLIHSSTYSGTFKMKKSTNGTSWNNHSDWNPKFATYGY